MSVPENPKKRSSPSEENNTDDEPFARTTPPDIKVIYQLGCLSTTPEGGQPSVWRLAEILSQFKVDKIQISQSGYKIFSKQQSYDGVATIFLCKGAGTVKLQLFSDGDGGWHRSESGFDLEIAEKVVLRRTKTLSDKYSFDKIKAAELESFLNDIGADVLDASVLQDAIKYVLPSWIVKIRSVVDLELEKDRPESESMAFDAFAEVFQRCV